MPNRATGSASKKSTNGQLPFPTDGPLLTVGELLRKEGKSLSLKEAQAIGRRQAVLGLCTKSRPLQTIASYLVFPRAGEAAMLERDDVLVKLLEHQAEHEEVHVQSLTELSRILPDGKRRATFKEILNSRAKRKAWPVGVGMLRGAKEAHIFLVRHIVGAVDPSRPAAVATPTTIVNGSVEDFPRAFNDAFDQLRRERPLNLVELSALRRALPGFTREAFDRGLRELRKSSQFVLETFEARHGALSAEEAAAAIREDGRVFAYAARRDHG